MNFNKYLAYTGIIIIILINEFTLNLFLENYSLKGTLRLRYLRLFDLLLLLLSILSLLNYKGETYLKLISKFFLSYMIPIIITVLIIDFAMFFLGYGYQSKMSFEESKRYPSPGDTFAGRPNVLDHNNLGFKGKFITSEDSYNIAIFGGSTGYNGEPPIIETVANSLSTRGIETNFFNFSSVSSNHTQHIHRLIKYVDDFNFDIVIFYGGGNSTFQYTIFEPRPGYPPTFFFLNELHPFLQILIRYSSIIGTIDIITNGALSGYKELSLEFKKDSNWSQKIIDNYWKDLNLANRITNNLVTPNKCSRSSFISITQPLNPSNKEMTQMYILLKKSLKEFDNTWFHQDLTFLENKVEFTDWVHVTQTSRDLIAGQIASEIIKIHDQKC